MPDSLDEKLHQQGGRVPAGVTGAEHPATNAGPCYSAVIGSDEMHTRALAWRARPSVAFTRGIDAQAVRDGTC